MYPTDFDLDVWSGYQIRELRRAGQRASLPPRTPRLRTALAQALIALANRLRRPEPPVARPTGPAIVR